MSAQPITNDASKKISIKRKRVPIWPLATRPSLELALTSLISLGRIKECDPPCEWRIHPSTEARGSGFQHERFVWCIDDENEWTMLKIRQHATDPSRTAGRTGFEGNHVSGLNAQLAGLLRSITRGGGVGSAPSAVGGCGTGGPSASRKCGNHSATPRYDAGTPVKGTQKEDGKGAAASEAVSEGGNGTDSPHSADHFEEEAAAEAATPECRGAIPPTDGVFRPHVVPLPHFPGIPPSRESPPGDCSLARVEKRRSLRDAWSEYMGRPVHCLNPGPSRTPCEGAIVQWSHCGPPPLLNSLDFQANPVIWIDDPDRPPSPPRSPSHISNSASTSPSRTPSSVPSTVPEVDPDMTPEGGSVESGRPTRGSLDGRWSSPDGRPHPLNIYDGSDYDSDYDSNNFSTASAAEPRPHTE